MLVEVHVANGLPQWTLVGLAATAVKESRDRVHAALANSGFTIPPRRITVNLQPGDLPKTGTAFDLPIALALLAASGQLPPESLLHICAVGELGLDGQLRSVRGVLAVARHVAATSDALLIVPPDNLAEALRVPRARAMAPRTLVELVAALRDGSARSDTRPQRTDAPPDDTPDLGDVVGQSLAVRALEIAAAGSHNLLLVGPPGAGKTALVTALAGELLWRDEYLVLVDTAPSSNDGLQAWVEAGRPGGFDDVPLICRPPDQGARAATEAVAEGGTALIDVGHEVSLEAAAVLCRSVRLTIYVRRRSNAQTERCPGSPI